GKSQKGGEGPPLRIRCAHAIMIIHAPRGQGTGGRRGRRQVYNARPPGACSGPGKEGVMSGSKKRRTIRIGHSPDPDDAFMFHGLASGEVPTPGYEIVQVLKDIESLNRLALQGDIEVSAVSIHAYAHLADRYALLSCGASMGDGYGPIV